MQLGETVLRPRTTGCGAAWPPAHRATHRVHAPPSVQSEPHKPGQPSISSLIGFSHEVVQEGHSDGHSRPRDGQQSISGAQSHPRRRPRDPGEVCSQDGGEGRAAGEVGETREGASAHGSRLLSGLRSGPTWSFSRPGCCAAGKGAGRGAGFTCKTETHPRHGGVWGRGCTPCLIQQRQAPWSHGRAG